jgi:hypothetical protein
MAARLLKQRLCAGDDGSDQHQRSPPADHRIRRQLGVPLGQREQVAVGDALVLPMRSASTHFLSARLIESGQKRCPGIARRAASIGITVLGGPGDCGYFGWPTMRSWPFSVSGQVAKACLPVVPNQSAHAHG